MLKAFIGNNAGNREANARLRANATVVSFGSLCLNHAYDFGGTQFITALCYSDQYAPLTVENFKLAAEHPQNSHLYFVGINEADLARATVLQHAFAIQQQMDLVMEAYRQVGKEARFVIGHLSQLEPLWKPDGHFLTLWHVLRVFDINRMYLPHIIGFSQHMYPPVNPREFLHTLAEWKKMRFPNRQIIIGETGRSLVNPQEEYSPKKLLDLCKQEGLDGLIWFVQALMYTAPTDPLQAWDGTNLKTGNEFAEYNV